MEIIQGVLSDLGFDPTVFVCQLVLFYAMHLVLTPILYRPLEAARNERDQKTFGTLEEAEKINNEALALKARYEAEVRQARQAAQAFVQKAAAEAEEARQARLDRARQESEAVIQSANREVAEEKARAQEELQGRVPELSLAVATRLVESTTSDSQRDRVVGRLREAS